MTQPKPKQPTGYVIYRGPSMLDGDPIVAIAIHGRNIANAKTGNMIQTYILVDNGETPYSNAMTLDDISVCGLCPHRHGTGGACYVRLNRGPNQVWQAYKRGNYPHDLAAAAQAAVHRMVRLGSYGDPAAVPLSIWRTLTELSNGHTGYTHQWQDAPPALMDLCMASVDSEAERILAKAMGYRTFRIRTASEVLGTGEFMCPASAEAGKRMTCERCGACSGGVPSKADPAIIVHGTWQRRFAQDKLF